MQRGYHALPNYERCFSASKGWTRPCLRWVIHVIPAIAACPVHAKSGHSANARVYECTAYGAAENKSLESKTLPAGPCAEGQHARGVVSFPLRTSRGRGV